MRHRTAQLLKGLADGLRPAADHRVAGLVRRIACFAFAVVSSNSQRSRASRPFQGATAAFRYMAFAFSKSHRLIGPVRGPRPLWPEPCCIGRHASVGNTAFAAAVRAPAAVEHAGDGFDQGPTQCMVACRAAMPSAVAIGRIVAQGRQARITVQMPSAWKPLDFADFRVNHMRRISPIPGIVTSSWTVSSVPGCPPSNLPLARSTSRCSPTVPDSPAKPPATVPANPTARENVAPPCRTSR